MRRFFSLTAVLATALAGCSDRAGNGITDPVLRLAADHVPGSTTADHAVGVVLLTPPNITPASIRIVWHKDPAATSGTSYHVQVYSNSTCTGSATYNNPGVAGTPWTLANHLYFDPPLGLDEGSYCAQVKAQTQGPGGTQAFKQFVTATIEILGANQNQPPTAGFTHDPADPDEGESVQFTGAADDPDGDALTYEWRIDGVPVSAAVSFNHVFDDNGTYEVSFAAADGNGGSATETQYVNVANVAPTAAFNAPTEVAEGSDIDLSLTDDEDPSIADEAAGFEYAFACGDGAGYGAYTSTGSASCPTTDNGVRTVKGKVRDKDGGESEYTATVTVNNVAPTILTFDLSTFGPLPVSALIGVSGTFSDPGSADTHTLALACGGGVASGETAVLPDYGGTCTYASAGVYQATITLTDDDGGSDTRTSDYIVVYDPSAGFVTGGGWIQSPAGACLLDSACSSLAGKANFGFVSKYQKGATVPTGNTEFQFHAGNLNFKSVAYQWLVVAGAKAQYKGTGTINGAGDYGFLLTAIDGQLSGGGGVDRFRIKIWDVASGNVVYDNQMGADEYGDAATTISGGSIVLHTPKK